MSSLPGSVKFTRKGDTRISYKELGYFTKSSRPWPNQEAEVNLELRYAISVHKAQGSEFERIYAAIPRRQAATAQSGASLHGAHARREALHAAGSARRRRDRRHATQGVVLARRINSSLLGWHVATQQPEDEDGWREAAKVHQPLSRHMVRSKSAVIIVNMLHERGIRFWHEEPLFAPDGDNVPARLHSSERP